MTQTPSQYTEDGKITCDMKVGALIFRQGTSMESVLRAAARSYNDWNSLDPEVAEAELISSTDVARIERYHPQENGEPRQYVVLDAYCSLQQQLALLQQQHLEMPTPTFQQRVGQWVQAALGTEWRQDEAERDWRFCEESLELIQARGNMTLVDILRMAQHVYSREKGEVFQEVGGVMTCLAALVATEYMPGSARLMDMQEAGEAELTRVWGKIEQIRAKHKNKPRATDCVAEHDVLTAFQDKCIQAAEKLRVVEPVDPETIRGIRAMISKDMIPDEQLDKIRTSVMTALFQETAGVIGGPDVVHLQFPARFAEAVIEAVRIKLEEQVV